MRRTEVYALLYCLTVWLRHPYRWTITRPAYGTARLRHWTVERRSRDSRELIRDGISGVILVALGIVILVATS